MKNSLIIACDGEAASGKSTGAKLISKKYKLLLINSGLFYRYASKIIIENKPKKIVPFLRKELKKIKYEKISSQNLHTQEINKPRYDIAFYFKCNNNVAGYRRWLDLKKKVPLKEVKKTLRLRTKLDKTRVHSPLKRVKDAILIRSDKLSKKQMLEKMTLEINKKLKKFVK